MRGVSWFRLELRSYTRSIRGQYEVNMNGLSTRWLAMSFWSKIATLELALLILSPTPTCIEQAHLSQPTVLALFSIHFALMFLLLVFMSFHFTCTSFHFDDPRSSMFSPMSVKRILNAEGTAFTWMLSTREQFYFIPPVPTSTSACTNDPEKWSCLVGKPSIFGVDNFEP